MQGFNPTYDPTFFANKYRIKSTRLKNWDYSTPWWYFVTICTKDSSCYFGRINNGKIALTKTGKIVAEEWQKTEQIRQNVDLDEWVVMPNHLHGIIIITASDPVETHCNASLQNDGYKNKFGPQSNNLASIIRGFKGIVTKRIRLTTYKNFSWQTRFYDRIIRNDKALYKIRNYIHYNPEMWDKDEENPKNKRAQSV